jgi:MYXO-CTERM domain-containing protein
MNAQHLRYAGIALALVTVSNSGAALAQEVTTTTQSEPRDEGFDWGLLGLLGLAGLLGRKKAEKPDMHIDHTKARS